MDHGPGHRAPFDPARWRRFLQDGLDLTQVQRGVVGWEGDGDADYFQIGGADADVALHVTTADGAQLVCRLHAPGGLWAIPPLDDEVMVLHAQGEHRTVGAPVAVWGHHTPPANLAQDTRVLAVPDKLLVGAGATKEAARKDDAMLGGHLSITAAGPTLTFTYTPQGGVPVVASFGFVAPAGVVTITPAPPAGLSEDIAGKITEGSAKTKIE